MNPDRVANEEMKRRRKSPRVSFTKIFQEGQTKTK